MSQSNFRKRIDPVLRDIKPILSAPQPEDKQTLAEPSGGQEAAKQVPKKWRRKIRLPKKLATVFFLLTLIGLILVIAFSSLPFLTSSQSGGTSLGRLKDLVGTFIAINSNINKLKAEGFNFAFNGKGEELITTLKDLERNVAKLDISGISFIDEATLNTAKEGLDALITLLDKPGEQHLLVLFLNPSEIRPIGGFAGSYGEVILEHGNIKEVKANDIYYPDRFLDKKIVPPRQLQSVTVDWGGRDAAWFFDFPTSAKKTIELIEASRIYTRDNTQFDGVIALNVRVIEDILALTGPIKLPEYNLTLTKDNFLEEIQREVEVGPDKKPGENPKRVISSLTPILIERLSKLDSSDKNTLALALLTRATNKDIQFYFDDPKVEQFAEKIGWAGKVASLPDNFGDYLAVVNTNVAGGKTDARIEQKIKLKSEIDASGRVNDHLTITRHHSGKADDAPWYRVKNQNFIKIFTGPGSQLVSLLGATPKTINAQVDYVASGYSRDPVLESVELTRREISKYSAEAYLESGKNVFAAWFSALPGESKTLEANYKSSQLSLIDGTKYRFIFDKQSGVESSFEYEVAAPAGYKWQESGGSTFAYKSDAVPSRLVIDLTLVRS